MIVPRVEYMYWAKTAPAATYNLAMSGMPHVPPDEYGARPEDLNGGKHHPYGDPRLIEAIAERYGVDPAGVVLLPGTSLANFVALAANLERGATVLVETPVYDCIPRTVEFFGCQTRHVERRAGDRFQPDLQQVEDGLQDGAAAVFLTDLHNPSGLRLTDDTLRELADLTARHGAALIIDEVYRDALHICGGEPLRTAASLAPHVTTTNSLTKVYGLGRLRAGWLIAEPQVAERARNAGDCLMVVNPSPTMNLAVRAFANVARLEERSRNIHARGWAVVRDWLAGHPDITCPGNEGTIFVWLNLSERIDARRLVERLVEKYDTLVVPGHFFGCPHHVRLGFGREPELVREGLDRLDKALADCRRQS